MHYKHVGFSLVELMVTIAIAAILAMVAVPMMQGVIAGQSTSAEANDLSSMIRLAHSEAIKRGVSVSICASSNPDNNPPSCGDSWSTGWVVFTDVDGDGNLDDDDTVVKVHSTGSGISSVTESAGVGVVTFLANGLVRPTEAVAAGDIVHALTVSPKGSEESDIYTSNQQAVCISRTGRVQIIKGQAACQ